MYERGAFMLSSRSTHLIFCIALTFGVLVALIMVVGAESTARANVLTLPTTPPSCNAQPQVLATLYFSDSEPMFVTVNPATGYAYVSSHFENEIFVLRGTQLVTTITSITPTYRIAANPATGYVYLSADTVYVLSATEVMTAISVIPGAIAINPVTNYVYIAESGASTAVLSGTQVITSIPAKSGVFGVDSVRGYIYSSWLFDYPGETYVSSGTQVLGAAPAPYSGQRTISVNPATGYAYVAYHAEAAVQVLSGTESLTTIPVGLGPWQSASDSTTGYVYVPNTNSDSVTVISGTEVVTTVPTDRYPYDVVVNSASSCVYVRNYYSNTLTILSGTQKIGTTPIEIGASPLTRKPDVAGTISEMAIDPVAGLLYVANSSNHSISIISERPIFRVWLPVIHNQN
jgi:DNA-binding beta-propeller fold protein YncE